MIAVERSLPKQWHVSKKMKMANLLHSGGFSEEASAPADQALQKGQEACSILSLDLPGSTAALQVRWNDKRSFAECAEEISTWMNEISTTLNGYGLGL
jgi:hypothetical protein